MKNLVMCLFLVSLSHVAHAQSKAQVGKKGKAVTEAVSLVSSCGALKQIVIEPKNPAGNRLQVAILEKDTGNTVRSSVSERLYKMPETIKLLQLAMTNNLELCLNAESLSVLK